MGSLPPMNWMKFFRAMISLFWRGTFTICLSQMCISGSLWCLSSQGMFFRPRFFILLWPLKSSRSTWAWLWPSYCLTCKIYNSLYCSYFVYLTYFVYFHFRWGGEYLHICQQSVAKAKSERDPNAVGLFQLSRCGLWSVSPLRNWTPVLWRWSPPWRCRRSKDSWLFLWKRRAQVHIEHVPQPGTCSFSMKWKHLK